MAFCNGQSLLLALVAIIAVVAAQYPPPLRTSSKRLSPPSRAPRVAAAQHYSAAIVPKITDLVAAFPPPPAVGCALSCNPDGDTEICEKYGSCTCNPCPTAKPKQCQATNPLLQCVSSTCQCQCAWTFSNADGTPSPAPQCTLQCNAAVNPKCQDDANICACDPTDCPQLAPVSCPASPWYTCVGEQCAKSDKCQCNYVPICPAGWAEFGDFCYFAITDSSAQGVYNAFEQECVSLTAGGHLASIHSNAENSFIINLIQAADPNKNFFFGLHTNNPPINDGSAFYADGSPVDFGDPVANPGVAPWNGGEPNNAGGVEACAHFWATSLSVGGLWNDIKCTQPSFGAVCKAPKV